MHSWMEIVVEITQRLEKHQIPYEIGGSASLWFHGIKTEVHDLDFLFDVKDQARVLALFENDHPVLENRSDSGYHTSGFAELKIRGMDVDLMFGFAIAHEHGVFRHQLWDKPLPSRVECLGKIVIVASLEEWLVWYALMRREEKVKMIQTYFETHRFCPVWKHYWKRFVWNESLTKILETYLDA
ncbi:MAG: hypothetical protein PHP32_06320 [Candidatus Izemoplasmatales bacterium]|nr:hypothetical protein [Candidatus Izemoplasmatales bacterium]